jgi:hypothetical protein
MWYKGLNNVKALEGTYFRMTLKKNDPTPAEETEVERTRRKAHKDKAMSRFNADLRTTWRFRSGAFAKVGKRRSTDNSRSKHSKSSREEQLK